MASVRYYNSRNKQYSYVDINCNYTLDQQSLRLTGDDAVINCFINLIMTSPGDIWFNPTYGSGVYALLFDLAVSNKVIRVFNRVSTACSTWLPMITLYKNKCTLNLDSVTGKCEMVFVLSINQASPITLGMTVYR